MLKEIREVEKKLKLKIETNQKELSETQQGIVDSLIENVTSGILKQLNDLNSEVNNDRVFNKQKQDAHDDGIVKINNLGNNLIAEVRDLKKEFILQRERFDINIRKMVKDKRHFMAIYEVSGRKYEKTERVEKLIMQFLNDVGKQVNQLISAQEIDVSLYVQDEMDRQQTVLYGINEEAGKTDELKQKTTISVNKNCAQCSGN